MLPTVALSSCIFSSLSTYLLSFISLIDEGGLFADNKFCGLNYNTEKYILEREKKDADTEDSRLSLNSLVNDEVDDDKKYLHGCYDSWNEADEAYWS